MWLLRTKALCLGLSASSVDWQATGLQPDSASIADLPSDLARIVSAIEKSSKGIKHDAVYTVVGSSSARHWLQIAPPGLRSLAELKELVRSKAELLFGSKSEWTVAADWHATRPFLCAAIPLASEELTRTVATHQRAKAVISTTLIEALARLGPELGDRGWKTLYEPGALHLLHLGPAGLDQLRTLMVPTETPDQEVATLALSEIGRQVALNGSVEPGSSKVQHLSTHGRSTQSRCALTFARQAKRSVGL